MAAGEEAEVKIGKKSNDAPAHTKRSSKQSVGSDRSFDTSPLHPHHHPRTGNRGSADSSPMVERKTSSEVSHGAASSTPGRSRLKPAPRGDESFDDGPVIPKFGGWDDNDPRSGEGYTDIFNKAREDKHNGGNKSPMITTETTNFYGQNPNHNNNSKCFGCFPWSKK